MLSNKKYKINNINQTLLLALMFMIATVIFISPLSAQENPVRLQEDKIPPPTIDTDNDGVPDAWDRDKDGRPDVWDTDGDNLPDIFDNDGDGEPDEAPPKE